MKRRRVSLKARQTRQLIEAPLLRDRWSSFLILLRSSRSSRPSGLPSRTCRRALEALRALLALDRVSVMFPKPEFVCLVGGERMRQNDPCSIHRWLETDRGKILADKPVTGPGREATVIFREPALFPWMTSLECSLRAKAKTESTNRDRRELPSNSWSSLGLSRFQHANMQELSRGMKQRVSGSALAPKPRLLLMDDPFAPLDALRAALYGDIQ